MTATFQRELRGVKALFLAEPQTDDTRDPIFKLQGDWPRVSEAIMGGVVCTARQDIAHSTCPRWPAKPEIRYETEIELADRKVHILSKL